MIVTSSIIKMASKITNSFYEDLKIEFLFHSNHLEGSTFSKDNLTLLLKKKIVEGSHQLDDVIETKNSLELFDKVIKDCGEAFNKFMLFDWHRTLKAGSVDEEIKNTGCWKKYENKLSGVNLKLAYPQEVDGLMFNLIADWEESNKTLDDLTIFHYKFERIHPFQDGNGRIGRFIILKQCIENGIDLISIDYLYDKEYRNNLYKAQSTDDYLDLKATFIKSQERVNDKFVEYVDLIHQLKDELQNENEIEI